MRTSHANASGLDQVDDANPRDRFFCPWRIPKSPSAVALVSDVLNQVTRFEQHRMPRVRARRDADQAVFEQTVAAVVCDMLHVWLVGDSSVAVSRSNRELGRKSRYRSPVLGKQFPHVLDLLAAPEMDFIEAQLGFQNPFGRNQRTLIRPGRRLITRTRELGLELSDLGRNPFEEIIILKGERPHPAREADLIEYQETEATTAQRSQLQRLNTFLEDAPLILYGGGGEATANRRLQRFFTRGSFTSGGRLFGGFWLELRKQDRQQGLQIDGEPTVELDFAQMAPNLLYAYAGARPTVEDAYLLPSLSPPELFRPGIKKLFNALLFSEAPLLRKPQGTKGMLPNQPLGAIVDELRSIHQPVSHLFETGIGHHLQFLESETILEVLTLAMDNSIVALPIHDAIIVRLSSAKEARRLMEEVFLRRTGIMPKVNSQPELV